MKPQQQGCGGHGRNNLEKQGVVGLWGVGWSVQKQHAKQLKLEASSLAPPRGLICENGPPVDCYKVIARDEFARERVD